MVVLKDVESVVRMVERMAKLMAAMTAAVMELRKAGLKDARKALYLALLSEGSREYSWVDWMVAYWVRCWVVWLVAQKGPPSVETMVAMMAENSVAHLVGHLVVTMVEYWAEGSALMLAAMKAGKMVEPSAAPSVCM